MKEKSSDSTFAIFTITKSNLWGLNDNWIRVSVKVDNKKTSCPKFVK